MHRVPDLIQDIVMTLAIGSFGRRIGIDLAAPELIDEAMLRLPPGWEPVEWNGLDREVRLEAVEGAGDGQRRYTVLVDGERYAGPAAREAALDRFEDAIQYYLAEFSDPWIFVHAGVVAWEGRAIVLPGRSHSGKSTLTAALVEAGATYSSDEYAVLGDDGLVRPYARRLSLREGPFGPAGRIDLSDRALAGEEPALPIGVVAILRWDEAAGWATEEITTGSAIMAMCDNTVPIQRRPGDTLAYLSRALAGARAIQGTRGDARAAAAEIIAEASRRD